MEIQYSVHVRRLGGVVTKWCIVGGGGDTGTGDLFTFAHAQRRRCCCCPVLGEPRREHCLPLSIDSLNCSVIHRTVFVCLQRKGEVKERWMDGWRRKRQAGNRDKRRVCRVLVIPRFTSALSSSSSVELPAPNGWLLVLHAGGVVD